ncbi:MAG: AMP-binding protein [Planctomycetes bacterium]|nr:AMP-binding protein [Planctomycetota bacterium]
MKTVIGKMLMVGALIEVAGAVFLFAASRDTRTAGWFTLWSGVVLFALGAYLAPYILARRLIRSGSRFFYKVRMVGREHMPRTGGALLVANHLSFVDGLFIMLSTRRPVRFLVEESYFNNIFLKPWMKVLGCIAVAQNSGPKDLLRALRRAGDYLDAGEVVCIFAEGQITRTGMLLPFKRGLERIVRGRNVPIVPVNLDRVWGSIFSNERGRFVTKLPRRFPYPVTVSFGAPLPSSTPAAEIRAAVQDLATEAWIYRKDDLRPLPFSLASAARRHPFRTLFADEMRGEVSGLKSLTGSIALARALRPKWTDQKAVGILLPPSVAGALVNMAAHLTARTVVNLNYTTGKAGIESACRQAGLKTVVTSRRFIEKAKLELPEGVEIVLLEDIAKTIGGFERVKCLAMAALAPYWLIERVAGALKRHGMDDVCAIIFSSGSSGEPKGAQITHYNLLSNCEASGQALHFGPHDRLLHLLPFFHTFGNMMLWAGIHHGCGLVFAPNPLDASSVGMLAERFGATIICASPTFLGLYTKRVEPRQFGSLRMVISGAEKLQSAVQDAFEARFGLTIQQGYGCTECSPVVAVNTEDYRAPGYFQPGNKPGTVGQPLPGVNVKIADPETLAPLPHNTPGMLMVRGPNVMKGYLGRDDLTAKVLRDGWYITGDIALIDDDGFIRITDRLSRFSKIGGEMVPHCRVEEALHAAAGISESQAFAVTAVADEKKGERLIVLHVIEAERIGGIVDALGNQGLPNLFIPKPNQFHRVEAFPLLGTGKIDLRALKRIAEERANGN